MQDRKEGRESERMRVEFGSTCCVGRKGTDGERKANVIRREGTRKGRNPKEPREGEGGEKRINRREERSVEVKWKQERSNRVELLQASLF